MQCPYVGESTIGGFTGCIMLNYLTSKNTLFC